MVRISIVLAVLILAGFAIWHPAPEGAPRVVPEPTPAHASAPRQTRARVLQAVVYVAGAVARPGLYRLPVGSRVNEAVKLAGGLRADADAISVNLAARVQDGDEIAVPVMGEKSRPPRNPRKHSQAKRLKTMQIVNLNSADATALAAVPGIGTALAQRIVALRENEGPFETLDQLLDVAGMTQTKLDRASSYLSI